MAIFIVTNYEQPHPGRLTEGRTLIPVFLRGITKQSKQLNALAD
jgi:hypothetical protein